MTTMLAVVIPGLVVYSAIAAVVYGLFQRFNPKCKHYGHCAPSSGLHDSSCPRFADVTIGRAAILWPATVPVVAAWCFCIRPWARIIARLAAWSTKTFAADTHIMED